LYIKHGNHTFGWAAVVNFTKNLKKDKHKEEIVTYTVEVLMQVNKEAAQSKNIFLLSPPTSPENGEMQVTM